MNNIILSVFENYLGRRQKSVMIRVENASEETAGENVCSVHTYATTENLAISLLTSCNIAFLREPFLHVLF